VEGSEERGGIVTAYRPWVALAAGLLVYACASPGVELRTPQAAFGKAQNVLASVATAQGLTVMYVTSAYPSGPAYPRSRVVMEVFMPGEHQDAHAHTTPLVYSMEVNDFSGVTLWIASPDYAAPLCNALRAADVSFDVTEGGDRAFECR